MKIAIISDIHANLAALEAFPEQDCDRILCLGDLVDYGPSPKGSSSDGCENTRGLCARQP